MYVCRCATCPVVLGEVTGGCLGLKLGRKGFLDLCVMCLVLLLILRYFILTQCYCIFYRCQRRVQALALCCQALCQPWSFHDVQSSIDLLDVSDWFNRNSCSYSISLLSLSDERTAWSLCNFCLFNIHRHTALQCFDKQKVYRRQTSMPLLFITHLIVFQSN